ncbi:uncharacterized protein LOC129602788 [Paramacrobiotus metropolitanus]|uniref:uncharacterized protein LOC129602788 n=1 Tax=Paramacrobiotus metropolitanus TaxID=2943436 RepID=UPI002445F6F6|nr:uncharacterized protein LOC129602788 [Paramacrobiotus metropolitanus]
MMLAVIAVVSLFGCITAHDHGFSFKSVPVASADEFGLDDLVQEYHFHTYFVQTNADSRREAEAFHARVSASIRSGQLAARAGTLAYGPRGPHMIGNFYAWVPRESFQKAYNFYALNRGNLTVLIHPLTKMELLDHTTRAVWMGVPLPLDMAWIREELTEVPLEFPELQLGYSAPKNQLKRL